MFAILRNLVFSFALTLTASATSIDIVNRQIDASLGGKLVVDVNFGSVTVSPGADDKVVLEANRKINFQDDAKEKEYLAAVPITVAKEGNVVTIRSREEKKQEPRIGFCQRNASYVLHVPKKFETALRTDGGAIQVSDITGNLNAHTSGGHLTFARLEGTLEGETSGGFIEVEDCHGPIQVKTSGGHINVTRGNGVLSAHTSGGHIEVRNFSGDTEVQTSGGGLELEKISGKLVGETSGGGIHASIAAPINGDVKLETSAGNIDLSVPANAALNIDANASVGTVVSRLPIQPSDVHRDHLRGTLNGGGKSVRLGTLAGNITIKPLSEEVANLKDTSPRHE